MQDLFRLPLVDHEGTSSEKNAHLLQIIVVISSGILSSSTLAAMVKAWLDNRKVSLTIQVDGNRKTLTYEGHSLNQDAASIQTLLEKMSAYPNASLSIDAVAIDLTANRQKEEVFESGSDQAHSIHSAYGSAVAGEQSSLLKRLLPAYLHSEFSSRQKKFLSISMKRLNIPLVLSREKEMLQDYRRKGFTNKANKFISSLSRKRS